MYKYLYLIPFGIIYITLFFIFIPGIEGRGPKIFTALLLIPVAYFLAGYVDHYLPRWIYLFSKRFNF